MYLDFNDIVLNILGAALGVVLLLGIRTKKSTGASSYEPKFRRVFYTTVLVSLLMLVSAFALGKVVMLADQIDERSVFSLADGKLSFIMSFETHDQFWQKSYFGKVFHVLSPAEGLALIAVLCASTWVGVRWLNVRWHERIP